jgi:predicted esterase
MHRLPKPLIFLIFVLISGASPLYAQVDRYELGQRLKRVESAWQEADEARRAAMAKPMDEAVKSFFGLQLRTAAARLDKSYLVVTGQEQPSELKRFAISRRLAALPLLADTTEPILAIELEQFYDGQFTRPAKATLDLKLLRSDGSECAATSLPLPENDAQLSWSPEGWTEAGDFLLTAAIRDQDGDEFPLLTQGLSRVSGLAQQLGALEQFVDSPPAELAATPRATLKNWLTVLKALVAGEVQECDYPAARLLAIAGTIIAQPQRAGELLAESAQGRDTWLALTENRKQAVVRVRAPAGPLPAGSRLPVLLLFHGAGGSENMFFETYGAGRAVKLGVERGWLVVAPRQGLGSGPGLDCEAMLTALEQLFPIDRQQVLLVGHSMGAAQVIRQASTQPELFRAAVVLGGGSAVRNAARLKEIAWYSAAGELDFGKGGAAALARSLKSADIPVTYKEYPDVEHMTIVQAALDDVFAFLDGVLKPAASGE